MVEEIRLIVGTPTVTATKIGKFGEVLIQADEAPGGNISVHYDLASEVELPPAVREKLLVAIIKGAYPQWLDSTPGGDMVDITYEADSANSNGHTMRLETVPTGDATRLKLTTWQRAGVVGQYRETVFLTQQQVASLIEMLLAVYPRLHDAEDA